MVKLAFYGQGAGMGTNTFHTGGRYSVSRVTTLPQMRKVLAEGEHAAKHAAQIDEDRSIYGISSSYILQLPDLNKNGSPILDTGAGGEIIDADIWNKICSMGEDAPEQSILVRRKEVAGGGKLRKRKSYKKKRKYKKKKSKRRTKKRSKRRTR